MRRAWLVMTGALTVAGLGGAAMLWEDGGASVAGPNARAGLALPWITATAGPQPATAPAGSSLDAVTRQALLSPEMMRMVKDALGHAKGDDRAALLAHARQTLLQRFPTLSHPLVLNLFERYVAYQDALLASAVPREGDLDAWRQHLGQRDRLRRAHFSTQEIEAFWSDEARAETHLLKRMTVLAAPGLTDAERDAALQQVEAQSFAPEEVAARRASVLPLSALKQTESFHVQQVPDAERLAQRAQLVGADAAERLALLDRQEADWQRRLDLYAQAPDAERATLVNVLFSEGERRRLEGAMGLRAQR
ncbi:MAG: hypothetical protein HY836_03950 [Aquabacterium sp.]|uniref:lipase secretion chaperone n=1 Tax=Aquabacterium sp. TaxID=1872578 RepID=UPI0025BF7AEF|nr:lipase secretion chaperone [Aquabacterium sp.]MBI5924729.1 hypothetical protein [Aquabacterium sp.]